MRRVGERYDEALNWTRHSVTDQHIEIIKIKNKAVKKLVIILLSIVWYHTACAQNFDNEKQQLRAWKIISTTQLTAGAAEVSTSGFSDKNWIDARVPTSVLGALVKAKIYPDPHFDLNNMKIPDASDAFNKKNNLSKYSYLKGVENPFKDPYWFRTSFRVPTEHAQRRVWLNFDGINYRADVFVNGRQIANSRKMAGMFLRFNYDITEYVKRNEENIIAVKIYQVDHVGTPSPGYQYIPFGPQRGWGMDIFKDVTLKYMAGWDCAPVIRDRNMGLYQDVYLTYSDDVRIFNPYVVTDLKLPDTTNAYISVQAELNNVTNHSVKGVLIGEIDLMKKVDFNTYQKEMPGSLKTIRIEKEVNIPANSTSVVSFSPRDFKQLYVKHPYLWWPNGYGLQYLHNLKLTFKTSSRISDEKNTIFGIRKITSSIKELDGEHGRIFYVNGQRIFSRGGWIQPEMLLDWSDKRIYDEARLLAESGVNMIGNEDMPSPPEKVMLTYDKYGLLIWETFYQCWTSYPGTPSFANPIDAELSLRNNYDIIKRYRNHASLVLWAAQNETMVRKELYVPLRQYVRELDTTRPWIATSSIDWNVDSLTPYIKPDLPTGTTDDGAPDYTWYPHAYYYDMILKVKQQMFRNELGVPAVSTLGSMEKYIFDLGIGPKNDIYPLDKKWAFHDAWDGNGYAYKAYDSVIRAQYGQPETVEDYLRRAQYINAGSYRAMYEAANHRMWNITTGVMLWKLNAVWPQVLWQIYDWFHNTNAGYFFAKKALEPLHIQLNENSHVVSIINTRHKMQKNLMARVRIYNFDLSVKFDKQQELSVGEDQYKELFQLPSIGDLSDVYFVRLELKNQNGERVSENLYWLSSKEKADFRALDQLEKVNLEMEKNVSEKDGEIIIDVVVKNPGDKLSFFNRLMITKGDGGQEVWPTFWSDNYITVFPGETRTITARMAKSDLDGQAPVLVLDKDI